MASYDLIGNIAIIKGEGKSKSERLALAKKILKEKPSIKTVLEKSSNVMGRLRTIKTKPLIGKKNLIAIHKENNCTFKFNVETCYFSPRLSNERQAIAEKIKPFQSVLVMFAGVGVYPIVIYKCSRPKKIVGIELGRECCKYFKENLKLNKIPKDKIEIIQGDVKKKVSDEKFDIVVMARPNLKETFLKQGLKASKKGTVIYYYGFSHVDKLDGMKKDLVDEAKKLKRKIRILKVVKAGEIAPYKHRWRLEIKVIDTL